MGSTPSQSERIVDPAGVEHALQCLSRVGGPAVLKPNAIGWPRFAITPLHTRHRMSRDRPSITHRDGMRERGKAKTDVVHADFHTSRLPRAFAMSRPDVSTTR